MTELGEAEVITRRGSVVLSGASRDGLAFRLRTIDEDLASELTDSEVTKINAREPSTRAKNVLDAVELWSRDETVPDDAWSLRNRLA